MADTVGDKAPVPKPAPVIAPHETDYVAFAIEVTPSLLRTGLLLTGDWHLAEDLVQDTLARVYRAWVGRGHRPDNPTAYARTALVRAFISHRRLRRHGELPVSELPEQPAGGSVDAALRTTLIRALQALPPRDRAVLVLRYLADRSVDEVARDLGRSPGAIRTQSSRALSALRASLADSRLDLLTP